MSERLGEILAEVFSDAMNGKTVKVLDRAEYVSAGIAAALVVASRFSPEAAALIQARNPDVTRQYLSDALTAFKRASGPKGDVQDVGGAYAGDAVVAALYAADTVRPKSGDADLIDARILAAPFRLAAMSRKADDLGFQPVIDCLNPLLEAN